jgi:hypothetical protein
LERDRRHNRCIPRGSVGGAVRFVIREENFSDSPVTEPADRACVPQTGTLNIERLALPTVGKPLTPLGRRHDRVVLHSLNQRKLTQR